MSFKLEQFDLRKKTHRYFRNFLRILIVNVNRQRFDYGSVTYISKNCSLTSRVRVKRNFNKSGINFQNLEQQAFPSGVLSHHL